MFKAILGAELHFINQTIHYVGAFENLRKIKFYTCFITSINNIRIHFGSSSTPHMNTWALALSAVYSLYRELPGAERQGALSLPDVTMPPRGLEEVRSAAAHVTEVHDNDEALVEFVSDFRKSMTAARTAASSTS